MDFQVNYQLFRNSYKRLGKEKFFNRICKLFKKFKLYSMSTDWSNDPRYILKFKGAYGDIIFHWKCDDLVVQSHISVITERLNDARNYFIGNCNRIIQPQRILKSLDCILDQYQGIYTERLTSLRNECQEFLNSELTLVSSL